MTAVDTVLLRAEQRAEARRIADRRKDAIQAHPSSVPSHVALLLQVARLIGAEDLPVADVRVTPAAEVLVDCSGSSLVESDTRRWGAAIGQPVTETPTTTSEGFAATQWSASGYDGTGIWWHVQGTELVPAGFTS